MAINLGNPLNGSFSPNKLAVSRWAAIGSPVYGAKTWKDLGRNNDAVASGSGVSVYSGFGRRGYAFDGSSYFDVGAPNSLEIYSSLTMVAWAKRTTSSNLGTEYILGKDFNSGARGFCFGISAGGHSAGNFGYLEVNGAIAICQNGVIQSPVGTQVTDSVGLWFRIGVSLDATGTIWTLYVNGVNQISVTKTAVTPNNLANWYIGGRSYPGYLGGFGGELDDVVIANRCWTDSDFMSDYRDTKSSYEQGGYAKTLNRTRNSFITTVSAPPASTYMGARMHRYPQLAGRR